MVVTGLGALTPVGNSVSELWENLVAGVSGAGMITHFDATKFKCRIAAELKGFDPLNYFDKKEMRLLDGYTVYGLVSVDEAMRDSDAVLVTGGLGPTKDDITKKLLCEYFGSELVESEVAEIDAELAQRAAV